MSAPLVPLKTPAARTAFLPTTRADLEARGWDAVDIVIISGDAYVDHPAFGPPLIARFLEGRGFRVGLIPQPDWHSAEPFKALGKPRLFCAQASARHHRRAGRSPALGLRAVPGRQRRRRAARAAGTAPLTRLVS